MLFLLENTRSTLAVETERVMNKQSNQSVKCGTQMDVAVSPLLDVLPCWSRTSAGLVGRQHTRRRGRSSPFARAEAGGSREGARRDPGRLHHGGCSARRRAARLHAKRTGIWGWGWCYACMRRGEDGDVVVPMRVAGLGRHISKKNKKLVKFLGGPWPSLALPELRPCTAAPGPQVCLAVEEEEDDLPSARLDVHQRLLAMLRHRSLQPLNEVGRPDERHRLSHRARTCH